MRNAIGPEIEQSNKQRGKFVRAWRFPGFHFNRLVLLLSFFLPRSRLLVLLLSYTSELIKMNGKKCDSSNLLTITSLCTYRIIISKSIYSIAPTIERRQKKRVIKLIEKLTVATHVASVSAQYTHTFDYISLFVYFYWEEKEENETEII